MAAKKQNIISEYSNKYAKFFILLDKYPEKRKLIADLLSIYISNKDSFPPMFELNVNDSFSEEVLSSTLRELNVNLCWANVSTPIRTHKKIFVKCHC